LLSILARLAAATLRVALVQVQHAPAVLEHRRQSLGEVQLAGVDLADESNEFRRRLALASSQALEVCNELRVGESGGG